MVKSVLWNKILASKFYDNFWICWFQIYGRCYKIQNSRFKMANLNMYFPNLSQIRVKFIGRLMDINNKEIGFTSELYVKFSERKSFCVVHQECVLLR